ncbi:hypothetical protein SLS64_012642 [Diaporthe eres]
MTLTKRVMPEASEYAQEGFNEVHITYAAFRARTYQVQLAKKTFAMADLTMFELRSATPPPDENSCFGIRIVFDKSPYPPVEEWRQDTGTMWIGAQSYNFWEFRDFDRETEESRAMGIDEAGRAE